MSHPPLPKLAVKVMRLSIRLFGNTPNCLISYYYCFDSKYKPQETSVSVSLRFTCIKMTLSSSN